MAVKQRKVTFSDTNWYEIKTKADRLQMAVGDYLYAAHLAYNPDDPDDPEAKGARVHVLGHGRQSRYECKAQGCTFSSIREKACWKHPQAGLRKVA